METGQKATIGVLALQGAFQDHIKSFQRLGYGPSLRLAQANLDEVDALVIPGGESTAMRIIAGEEMMSALKAFVHEKRKPVWGTCAGCILLSDSVCRLEPEEASGATKLVEKQSNDGYGDFIGGVGVKTCRNFFGRQADSFEAPLRAEGRLQRVAPDMTAVCIRAPAILEVLSPETEVLAFVDLPDRDVTVTAAVAQGPLLLTIFHPELTADTRLHRFFVSEFVLPSLAAAEAAALQAIKRESLPNAAVAREAPQEPRAR
ncbi:putative glutamine amidotransferase subunit pdxt [Besnoitia besnoiti]|uniref:glutaminase n=1 Tax=Besnoitia besnoiti TaxID=94643 RepID=A0A2A9M6G5_BESBE|nr:putative glutamine amidotransferase subunit pdxt [Besnoitia besnoiti]PFH31227.1 putative glutamine amidotransferase subunit pdxt [Besnoitia besnoiti]